MAAYMALYNSGELAELVEAAGVLLKECSVCPHCCSVNRLANRAGKCNTAMLASVSSYGPHFGEELPLVGKNGSGTIFFANCNLSCVFCQNYTISQFNSGTKVTCKELASIMLRLQTKGCHNINLVSPTHVMPQILEALYIATGMGLNLPLVYNSGGYDSLKTLKLLDGIIDIYMPDMKYSDDKIAEELSGAKNYPEVNRAAVKEMHRQVGDLQLDSNGIATRGLLIRHLVLPHKLAGTKKIVNFISKEVSKNSYINIMAQYHPCYKASQMPQLSRKLLGQELEEALKLTLNAGLNRLDSVSLLTAPLF